jgi:single-stranded DNA-binding protein
MKTFNRITAIGFVASPVVKVSQKGEEYLTFSLPVNTGYKENKRTVWFRCSVFGKAVATLKEYMVKGRYIEILGEITELSAYIDKTGTPAPSCSVLVREVSFLDKAGQADSSPQPEVSAEPPAAIPIPPLDNLPF